MRMTAKVVKNGLPQLINNLPRQVNRVVDGHADRLLGAGGEEVPVKTGRTKASGHIETIPDGKAVVYETPYVQALHRRNPFLARAELRVRPDLAADVAGLARWIEEQ